MALDTTQLVTIRAWAGAVDAESDAFLEMAYARTGSFDVLIRELLLKRISDGASNPTNISLPGGLTLGFSGSAATWQSLLKLFGNTGSGLDMEDGELIPFFETSRIVRQDLR